MRVVADFGGLTAFVVDRTQGRRGVSRICSSNGAIYPSHRAHITFVHVCSCHLREKVLAEAAHHFVLVADSRKDSKILGDKWKQGVPVEVAPFAWAKVFQNLQKMGCEKPVLRMGKMKAGPVVTDNG